MIEFRIHRHETTDVRSPANPPIVSSLVAIAFFSSQFVLTHPNIKIPDQSKIYSFNEANMPQWDAPMRETVEKWRVGEGKSGNRFSSRYIGSMVGDVHRTLLYGGGEQRP